MRYNNKTIPIGREKPLKTEKGIASELNTVKKYLERYYYA